MPETCQIALIESTELFRQSFTNFLESYNDLEVSFVLNEFNSENSARINLKSDLIIFDLSEDEQRNLALLKWLKSEFPYKRTIALSCTENIEQRFFLAKYYKVDAFFSKDDSNPDFIIETIRRLKLEGPSEMIVEKSICDKFIVNWNENSAKCDFSKKERQIIDEIIKGRKNSEIAPELGVSVRTIESHRKRIIERTGSKNMVGAIIKAVKWGYLFEER